jgi:galactose oxidase
LRADYYTKPDFSGPVVSRVDRHIDFNWGQVAPALGMMPGKFSVRWQGSLEIIKADTYTFYLSATGLAKLTVDGKVITSGTSLPLSAGSHALKLEFVKTGLDAAVKLEWSSPSLKRDVVSQQYLQPAKISTLDLPFANVQLNTNLLINSNFSGGTGGWVKYGASTAFTTVSPGRDGTGSALSAASWLWIQQDLPVSNIEAGQTYTLRGYARAFDGGTCTLGLSGGSLGQRLFNEFVTFRSSSYQEQALSLRVPSGTVWMTVYMATSAPECQFDDLSLIAGSTTPPPGGTGEVLNNGGFEADFESWGRYGGTSSIASSGQSGAKSLQVSNWGWVQQDIPGIVLKAQPYTLSVFARSATGSTCVVGWVAATATEVVLNVRLEFNSTTWEQKSIQQTVPPNLNWSAVYAASSATDCFFDNVSLKPVPVSPKAVTGEWSSVQSWPLIATHMANLTDGRVLAWSSYDVDRFGGRPDLEYTQAVIFNPTNNTFVEADNPRHDMFCAGLSMLPDGRIFAGGGGDGVNDFKASTFNGSTWSTLPNMLNRHWYGTSVAMPNGEVYMGYGRGSNLRSEVLRNGSWQNLPGISLSGIDTAALETPDWYPYLHLSPRGTLFHSGATTTMHELDLAGTGTTTNRGTRDTGEVYRQWGSAIMVDKGKIMITGGTPKEVNPGSLKTAVMLDINDTTPVATKLPDMNYTRTYQTTVLLPNGEVFIAGGNGTGVEFNDAQSRLVPEIYSPATNSWREVAAMSVPRNYHSTGTLLQDGRVLMAGGGLCGAGCAANHQDGQIYSPSYLFNFDGTAAARPAFATVPSVLGHNQTFSVTMSGSGADSISKFTLIKLSATTHAMNTDLRRMEVAFTRTATNTYSLTTEANKNILSPGYYYLFAVNGQDVPSVAAIVRVSQ